MSRPSNVGVLAMEMYVPKRFVAQEDLEAKDDCAGKYTIGLGQKSLAYTDDREDITSMFLTVTEMLLKNNNLDPKQIGRLEVGTETLIDKSKSVKTSLMRLFGDNTDLEGVTNVNACYGGTAAVFNSLAWIESSEWNGKYALVVCGDIAVYEDGPARPTGGCGTLAILLGPDAPLAIEPGLRSSHNLDVYDFYKPHHSEYAAVDGKLSQWAYLSSVDTCYNRYKQKFSGLNKGQQIDLDHFDFFSFHSPYNKLVQKGFARLVFSDARDTAQTKGADGVADGLKEFVDLELGQTYESRDLETALKPLANGPFKSKVLPACTINQNIGNCYTGSVWAGLMCLATTQGPALKDKRVLMFSYGSGSVASLFSFVGRSPTDANAQFTLVSLSKNTTIMQRLEDRVKCDVADFSNAMTIRASCYGKAPMQPVGSVENVQSGAYYLTEVNQKHHRTYAKKE